MRCVSLPGWHTPVSVLGFGCASLGSRVSAADGARAIEAALERGVNWFDVAPSYGDGEAEVLLGRALGRRSNAVAIVTKVGLAANPPSPLKKLIGRVARPVVAAFPGLRAAAKRARPDVARKVALDGATVTASLERSLARLGVERIAVLALHGPTEADVANEGVVRALEDAKRAGKIAAVGIAGSFDVFLAARRAGLDADVMQVENSPFVPNAAAAAALPEASRPRFLVTHSVFGVEGALERVRALVARGAVSGDPARLLLDYAFASNSAGVVLASTYKPRHLAAAADAADRFDAAAAKRLALAVGPASGGGAFGKPGEVADDMASETPGERDREQRRVRLA
jgi:aryl-alcohol dehydrogenase-like predicted oxidoreductase